MPRNACAIVVWVALGAILVPAQDSPRTALDKIDEKKVAVTLRPKSTPAEVLAIIGNRDGRYDSLAFRSDSGQMAVGGPDGMVRLWDLATLKSTGLIPHKDVVCLVFSQSGKTLIGGDALGNLKLWPINAGKLSSGTTLAAHKGKPIWAIALSSDGNTLITAGGDASIKIWDISKATPVLKATLTGHEERVRGMTLSRDGTLLATTSDRDKTVRLWDLGDKPKERAKLTPKSAALSVAISPDGKLLAAGCADGVVRSWSIGEKVEVEDDIRGGQGAVASLAFSPDGKHLLGLAKWDAMEDRAFLWDLKGDIRFQANYGKHIEAVAPDPTWRHIVVAHETSLYVIRLPE